LPQRRENYVTTTIAGTADEVDISGANVEREIMCWGTISGAPYQGSVRL
jgi:hypothetical protein